MNACDVFFLIIVYHFGNVPNVKAEDGGAHFQIDIKYSGVYCSDETDVNAPVLSDMHCANRCSNKPDAKGFFYNAITGKCNPVETVPYNTTECQTEEGSVYFKISDVNLLSNAVASQSSTYHVGQPIASKAIDGNTSGVFDKGRGSCTHTLNTGSRWWMVDFQSQFSVSAVILWNRLDGGRWTRLRDIRLSVGNSLPALNNDYNLCGHYTGPPSSAQDNPVRITCSRVMYGRYLKIEKQLPEKETLTLCEVEIDQ